MNRKIRYRVVLVCMLAFSMLGCSQNQKEESTSQSGIVETVANLFSEETTDTAVDETVLTEDTTLAEKTTLAEEASEGGTVIMTLGHGPLNRITDEAGKSYLQYEGGEMLLKYQIRATGLTEGVGFLIYVNGIPQPYHTADLAEDAYMHVFYPEDHVPVVEEFRFVPVTGEQGDELDIMVLSLNYPDFAPDMKKTKGFSPYHKTLGTLNMLRYDATPETMGDIMVTNSLSSLSVDEINLDVDTKQKYLDRNHRSEEDLSTEMLSGFYLDGRDMRLSEYFAIDGKESILLRMELLGCPLAEYEITVYLNHEPLSYDGKVNWQVTLHQGKIAVLEATLDTSLLDGSDTLYVIATPKNASKMEAAGACLWEKKTQSVYLYYQSEPATEE